MEKIGILEKLSTENKAKGMFVSAKGAANAKVQSNGKPPSAWGEKPNKLFTGPVGLVKASTRDEETDRQTSSKLKPGVIYSSENQVSSEPLWMKQQKDDLYQSQNEQIKHKEGVDEYLNESNKKLNFGYLISSFRSQNESKHLESQLVLLLKPWYQHGIQLNEETCFDLISSFRNHNIIKVLCVSKDSNSNLGCCNMNSNSRNIIGLSNQIGKGIGRTDQVV